MSNFAAINVIAPPRPAPRPQPQPPPPPNPPPPSAATTIHGMEGETAKSRQALGQLGPDNTIITSTTTATVVAMTCTSY